MNMTGLLNPILSEKYGRGGGGMFPTSPSISRLYLGHETIFLYVACAFILIQKLSFWWEYINPPN